MDLIDSGIAEAAISASIIKPEHLSKVIFASTADFLIVIGDRNMKNDSCQVRIIMPRIRITFYPTIYDFNCVQYSHDDIQELSTGL